jgi:hypothetical protein
MKALKFASILARASGGISIYILGQSQPTAIAGGGQFIMTGFASWICGLNSAK